MEPFDQIPPAAPLVMLPGEEPLTDADNNAAYVDTVMVEIAEDLRRHISVIKSDLSASFPDAERARLERILTALREAWNIMRIDESRKETN